MCLNHVKKKKKIKNVHTQPLLLNINHSITEDRKLPASQEADTKNQDSQRIHVKTDFIY